MNTRIYSNILESNHYIQATHEAVFPFLNHELVPMVEQSCLYKALTSLISSCDLLDLPLVLFDDNFPFQLL